MSSSFKTPLIVSPISEIDNAYIAGLFDGEGTVRAQEYKQHGTIYSVAIYNTNKDILDWLVEITGIGRVNRKLPRSPKHRVSYLWYLTGIERIVGFLESIQPHTKIKANHIKVMLKLLYHRLELNSRHYHHPTTKYDETLIKVLHTLNKRGKQ